MYINLYINTYVYKIYMHIKIYVYKMYMYINMLYKYICI